MDCTLVIPPIQKPAIQRKLSKHIKLKKKTPSPLERQLEHV